MAAALSRTVNNCRGWWKLPNASPVPHSPPLRLSRARDVCGGHAASKRTALTPATDCLPSSPLGGATGCSVPRPAGSGTASSLRLSLYWTLPPTPTHISPSDCTFPLNPGLTATHPPPATEHLHCTSLLHPGLTATPSSSHWTFAPECFFYHLLLY